MESQKPFQEYQKPYASFSDPQHTSASPIAPSQDGSLTALEICHYVWGGLNCFAGLLFCAHILIGISMLVGAFPENRGDPPPQLFGYLFIGGGVAALVFLEALGIFNILSGRWIRARKNRTASVILGAINCMCFPCGTALGVFTIILLVKPEVMERYEQSQVQKP